MKANGSATGYEPIQDLSDMPHAAELFDRLHEGMVVEMDYEWVDKDTGIHMGERKLHSEVITEWTRGKG